VEDDLTCEDATCPWSGETHSYRRKPISHEAWVAWRDSERAVPAQVRKWVYGRDGDRCRKCGRPFELELHHLQPWSEGGTHDPHNLITLCHACHREWEALGWSADEFDTWVELPSASSLLRLFKEWAPRDIQAQTWQLYVMDAWFRFREMPVEVWDAPDEESFVAAVGSTG